MERCLRAPGVLGTNDSRIDGVLAVLPVVDPRCLRCSDIPTYALRSDKTMIRTPLEHVRGRRATVGQRRRGGAASTVIGIGIGQLNDSSIGGLYLRSIVCRRLEDKHRGG